MLKMVDGTGIIGVDMICPLGVSAPQPPNYDRVELEGTGMLVLPNSLDAPLERLELGGKTEQVTTSGKNLFDFSNLESGRINISTGALEEHNHTRRLADYIDITDITSFSFYLPGYNKANGAVYVIIYYYDKDKNYLSYKPCGDKIEKYENITPVENAVYIKVSLEQNTIDNPQNIFKVQLEKGAKSTAYEPYTGGKPSPSPEYPQEIKNSGKWNEDKQKYEVNVKVIGKNLFNREKAKDVSNWISIEGDGYLKFPIRAKKGSMITFSYEEKLTEGKKFYLGIAKKETGTVIAWLYHDANSSISNSKYTIAAEEDYVYLMCNRSAIQTFLDVIKTLQVEISQTQTEYEPYKEQTLTLTSDRPITKWDRLVEQGGQIGWLYQSKIVSLTGGEEWKTSLNAFYTTTYNFIKDYEAKCSHYVLAGITNQEKNNIFSIGEGAYANSLWIRDTSFSAVQDFKAHLSDLNEKSDPIMVVSPAAQTEFVPLPQSEQNAIRALKTYYPTTVITADRGELDPDIKVTYRKEI